MSLRDVILVRAYDKHGQIIRTEAYSWSQWYDDEVAIIDSEQRRLDLGVFRIETEQYNSKGELVETGVNEYNSNGIIVRGTSKYADGALKAFLFDEQGHILLDE